MNATKKRLKTFALFLSGLILLHSCSVYRTPVSLQQAAQDEQAVKIVTVDDDTFKYKYIVYEDGKFYGVRDNPGEDVKFSITSEEVEEVLMKKGIPWWAWPLIVIGGMFLIYLVNGLITDDWM